MSQNQNVTQKTNLSAHQNQITAQKRTFRKLEDLNLMDNFLFQQMLSQEDEEDNQEFAKILLSTILGRPIRKVKITPQKNVLGIDTDKHGIRLDAYIEDISDELNPDLADAALVPDVYDIEPNQTYEKESLPKRVRYYHGLIDTQLLSAGTNYSKLPNMVIIMILPYDPFDQNRMVYTIQNQCEEDPSIPYYDGTKKIFLYTRGTEGNPRQALQDMLKYMEDSRDENVTNPDIAELQRLVHKVKHKKEVGINYMKSWEYEEMLRQEAFNDGHDHGYSSGHNDGIDLGIDTINHLNRLLIEAGRTEDLMKAAQDQEYQAQLLKEFHLETH